MILLSGLLPKRQTSEQQAEPPPAVSAESEPDAYRLMLEDRLTKLLSQMEGVGSVTVMITVGGSAEQIYA